MDKYIYDYTFKDVLIRIPEDGFPEIIHKGDTEWTRVYAGGNDDDYARAIKFEEGCWQDLKDVTYDEAMEILEEWGFVHKTSDFKDVFEFQEAYPSKSDREKALRNMTNEDIDKLIATFGTNQGKAYYASFKRTK